MHIVLLVMGAMLLVSSVTMHAGLAQSSSASPVAAGWQVTEVRDIAVEGEPVALSPDGRWLAGTAEDGTSVCAWDVATLTPTCADVGKPVLPALGSMALRWAPDSSAFAFVSGHRASLIFGDVLVFEVGSGLLVNLTEPNRSSDDFSYIGVDWTADSSQVIFVDFDVSGDPAARDTPFRIDRDGGEPVEIPLPAWSETDSIFYPPLAVGNEAVLVTVEASGEADGVWRVPFDGSEPVHLVPATGPNAIPRPLVASISRDGHYASVVSLARRAQFETEDTYFIVDLATGTQVPLASGIDQLMVTFAAGGDTGLTVRDERLATVDPATGAMQPVANSPEVEPWLMHMPVWADNDTVFLPGESGGTLFALAPAA